MHCGSHKLAHIAVAMAHIAVDAAQLPFAVPVFNVSTQARTSQAHVSYS